MKEIEKTEPYTTIISSKLLALLALEVIYSDISLEIEEAEQYNNPALFF